MDFRRALDVNPVVVRLKCQVSGHLRTSLACSFPYVHAIAGRGSLIASRQPSVIHQLAMLPVNERSRAGDARKFPAAVVFLPTAGQHVLVSRIVPAE